MNSVERFTLQRKRAIVTGARRGIGRAFADAGADIALVSRKLEALQAVAAEIADRTPQRTSPIACHMGKSRRHRPNGRSGRDRVGGIDILVNNAGTNPVMGPLTTMDEAAWDKIMEFNLKGPYLASVRVARAMTERGEGGTIINISSGRGRRRRSFPRVERVGFHDRPSGRRGRQRPHAITSQGQSASALVPSRNGSSSSCG